MQALWMVLAAFMFATMSLALRHASDGFNMAEIVCYRGVIGFLMIWALAHRQKVVLATHHPWQHVWRTLVGVGSMTCWFYAVIHLPLATAQSISYMSSIWMAAIIVGAALLRASRGTPLPPGYRALTLSVLVGFAGVLLMLRPTLDQDQAAAALIALAGSVMAAGVQLQVRALSQLGEPEMRTVYYFTLGSTLMGALALPLAGFSAWRWDSAAWLIPAALLSNVGQLCMTRALSRGATLRVANLQYTGLIFAVLYGMVLFDERLPLLGWAGMALIVASSISATMLRSRPR